MLRQVPEEEQPTGAHSSSHSEDEHRAGHIPPPTQLKTHQRTPVKAFNARHYCFILLATLLRKL